MRHQLLLLLLFLGFFTAVSAQIKIPKGKDLLKNKKVTDALKTKTSDAFSARVLNSKKDYDESNFNYAISFTDNAGLFESEEKYQNHKTLLIEGTQKTNAARKGTSSSNSAEEKAENANALGEMLYASNKFKSAETSFVSAVTHWTSARKTNSKPYALTLSNLGLLYQTTGRYTQSESFTVEALALREKLSKNSSAHAASINNLAVLRKEMGQFNEAEKLIGEAIEGTTTASGPESIAYAIAVNNKAMLYQAIGRYDEAEKLMEEAIAVAEIQLKEKSSNLVRFNMNLALLHQETGKFTEAENLYMKCMNIKEKRMGKHHPDYAHLERGLASLYLAMGKEDEVDALLLSAADIYRNKLGDKHPAYAATIHDLGNYYRSKGWNDRAGEYVQKAVDIRATVLGTQHPDYINSLENLALWQWQTDAKEEAAGNYKKVMSTTMDYIDRYFAPMSEREKGKFWQQLQPRLQRYNSFVADVSTSAPALTRHMFNYQLQTKALLLNSTNKVKKAILASGDQQLINKYLDWLDKKEELARLYTMSKTELAAEEIDLPAKEAEANSIEKALSSESNVFSSGYSDQAAIDFNKIKSSLSDGEALVEIIQFQNYNVNFTDDVTYAALIIDRTKSSPTLVLLNNGIELETTGINNYLDNMYELKDDPDAYRLYWEAIAKELGSPTRVYVSLDGVYNIVSLNTLKDNDGNYLIDKHETIVVTNSKDVLTLKSGKTTPSSKTADLFGYPNYGNMAKLSDLPGTKIEVENIDAVLQENGYTTNVYMVDDATEANVKASQASILHIATHGFFLPDVSSYKREKILGIEISKAGENPLHRSGIILANAEQTMYGSNGDHSSANNGILTAYETMNMSLENTDLVVLSACETGLGDIKAGEGVYGLQRAFQVAGTKSMVMSLWQVSDAATMMLMTEFYRNLAKGSGKQAAFLRAQKTVKAKYPQPFFWGAFVLIGN
jgi:tetratricopeptide (TPR) repeat protein